MRMSAIIFVVSIQTIFITLDLIYKYRRRDDVYQSTCFVLTIVTASVARELHPWLSSSNMGVGPFNLSLIKGGERPSKKGDKKKERNPLQRGYTKGHRVLRGYATL